MDPTAPLFLGYRPPCLPIRESIFAIVGICRWWWLRDLTANVVDSAAPLLFGAIPPHVIVTHRAIVWIDWSCRRGWSGWRSHWKGDWPLSGRKRSRRRGRRCGRRRWEGGGRNCRNYDWQRCRGTTPACRAAAEGLFFLWPHRLILCESSLAVIWE